ncbi:adenylate/guanylate cyclase domain-containing protein [Mycolicibacterium sp. ND9-15]|uniref:ATP-binding protein n=1 Tax=Mycolicibacterium sp. ND9-15 TaxID=3042320 RepID=UPI002DDA9CB9|nr:adenylate/guanylate cyclase domain-containing protein [Mycolicibacterium sp. ND9-15]WSE54371.1 adenylate/guanylate cyclase domain-containing protein [Mycolicibacterium sp. ND9-15]
MIGQPPSGTVTFLLTDLEGSTRLWEQDPEAMKAAMVRHDELLEKLIAAHRGHVFARMGDGMAAAFTTARDAVVAAAAFQDALSAQAWRTDRPLRARVGLHTDEAAVVDDTGYASLPINRCSRLMTAAHGGQTVVSGATEMLLRGQLPAGMDLVDLGEHRLRDLGRPTRIFQLVCDGDRESFPPLRTLDSFPGNLPAQVSSFIGREADVARVVSALDASRVVTVTGVGGVGKTRLALQVAADVLPHYRDGAWLVDLAPIRDTDGVAGAVATSLRLSNIGGKSLEDSLIEAFAQSQLLLLLDNCEHLLGPVARLVTRIERECPDVVILATSREGMAIDGEQLIALPPLAVGDPDEDVDSLIHSDAIGLFVERARQVKADFALTASNARSVVEVCRRLDGVALAIELAAARIIAMSPGELLTRLDRRFQVLAGARRGAVERHATLRAAIDWSYDLLSEAEQRLLGRMAVFSGGCTLEAVEEVCSGDPVQQEDVMDMVAGLVARSLVIAEDADQGTRYRLLETIRQYGEEKIAESGETAALTIRHAEFYAALSARATQNSYGPEQLVWASRIKLDHDNIRSALSNAVDAGNAPLAVRLVASQPHQEKAEGPTGEVLRIEAAPVIALPGAAEEPGYPLVLMTAAYNVQATGNWDEVGELCRQAAEAQRRIAGAQHSDRVEMDTFSLRAQQALAGGEYARAVTAYGRAAELALAAGYTGLAGIFRAYRVQCTMLGGIDTAQTVSEAEEAVALARQSGMPGAIVISLNALALALVDSDPVRARAVLRESIELASTPGQEVSSGVLTACLVAGRLRDWDLTLALTGKTMRLWRWSVALMQSAPCLSLCARAIADKRPEVAGVLRGAAYAAYAQAGASAVTQPVNTTSAASKANFVLAALQESGEIVSAAIGDDRRRELRIQGAAMTMDEAISYAVANIEAEPA